MSIDNTTKHPRPEWLFGRNPDAIERQEAEGQRQLVRASQLPREGLDTLVAERLGIKIADPIHSENDPLFVDVTLPEGWTLKPTSHAMWSELLDDTGVKRASIFYKAAFYDRNAFIKFEPTR